MSENHATVEERVDADGVRHVVLRYTDQVRVTSTIRGKLKDPSLPSKKNPVVRFQGGDHWSVERQKYVHRTMTVDRRNDRYHERVTDPDTGEIIRDCSERLSEHQGHGSAKGR